MSYIPDTFTKMKIDIYGKQKDEPNPYWYKILEGSDADFVSGYDWAVKDFNMMLENIMDEIQEIFTDEETTDDEKAQEVTEIIGRWLYGCRNELVVSMIEGMEQDDYDRRFEEAQDLPEDTEDDI